MEISASGNASLFTVEHIYRFAQPPGEHPRPITIPHGYERIELMTAGRGWVKVEGDWREVLPGDLVWNKPGDETIGRSDFQNPYACLSITLIRETRRGSGMPRCSRWPDPESVRAFTEEVSRLFGDEHFDRRILSQYIVGTLFFRATVHLGEEVREVVAPPVRAALDFMERHFARPCLLTDLSGAAGCSVPHLHDLFRKSLDETPHQWLMRRRLRAAREKLVATRQPVKQIALECGFRDTAAFTNSFKAHTSLPPTKYRERYVRLATLAG